MVYASQMYPPNRFLHTLLIMGAAVEYGYSVAAFGRCDLRWMGLTDATVVVMVVASRRSIALR
jgi:hypothetical protein